MSLTINQNPSATDSMVANENKPSGFIANEIISKEYTNDKGELKGGNNVGYQVSFSDINILSAEMREKLESDNPSALYHWDAFETIASSVQSLTPANIGKALNELLAEDMGKEPKKGGDKRLTNGQKNKYINGFYSAINRLKNLIDAKCKEIEEQENLVPTGFIVKNNGESKRTYQRMRKVSEPRGRGLSRTSNKQKTIDSQNLKLEEQAQKIKDMEETIARLING
jgi:predicted RNase H-like nuclease (RuvC/YqgF family)